MYAVGITRHHATFMIHPRLSVRRNGVPISETPKSVDCLSKCSNQRVMVPMENFLWGLGKVAKKGYLSDDNE